MEGREGGREREREDRPIEYHYVDFERKKMDGGAFLLDYCYSLPHRALL